MEHVSPHGLAFAVLQLVVVLALHWGVYRWHTGRRAGDRATRGIRSVHGIPILVALAFVAWYFVLRTQPTRRGADPFVYSLGLFDGISVAGLASLILIHVLLTRRHRPSGDHAAPAGQDPRGGEE